MLSHNFTVLSKFTIPIFWVLGTVWISASPKMCKKHLTLECFVFSYFPRTVFTFPMFCGQYYWCEDIISDPIFTQMFMWNSSLRNSTYFVPGPRPNISIFDPFVIEVYGNVYSTEEQVVSFTAVFQLESEFNRNANQNSFKKRLQ